MRRWCDQNERRVLAGFLAVWMGCASGLAGPYSEGSGDAANAFDAPVPGFVGPHGEGKARIENGQGGFENSGNYVNPIFFGWAASFADYVRSDGDPEYDDPASALGPVTGDQFDVVTLGDLNATRLANGDPPGQITLQFDKPIRNFTGADFVVYENGFISSGDVGVAGQILGELAYVEVSSNGVDFVRFDSASLTPAPVGPYGTFDSTNVHNLAGKHVNANGNSWGTPFDLAEVGLISITHVRIIDIPGSGAFPDSSGNPIYDAWVTWGSGGADIEAVGAISAEMTYSEWPQLASLPAEQRGENDDPDGDGLSNLEEYAFAMLPWKADAAIQPCRVELVEKEGNVAAELVFRRDERVTDVAYEIWVSGDLENWTLLAVGEPGLPLMGVNGFAPEISEASASEAASIGVIREMRVRDVETVSESGRRFFQIRLERTAS